MYINPFFYGVFVTLFVEMAVSNVLLIRRCIKANHKKPIKGGKYDG